MEENGEADGDVNRVRGRRLAGEVGILDEEHREDDRCEPSRPEQAAECDRRASGPGPEQTSTRCSMHRCRPSM